MFGSRFSKTFRSPVAAVCLAALTTLGSACSKDEKLEVLWEGPAKLQSVVDLPKAEPASKTNFDKLEFAGHTAKLVVPVDWKQGGSASSDWRNVLHRWGWIWPLLVAHQEKQDKESLKQATLLALDWIKADTTQGRSSEQMWEAGNPGWRAPALGYIVHAATDAKLLTVEQQQQLITSARKHAAYLANDENYKRDRDSALYLDYGLAAMCANLNRLKDCQVWKDIAKERVLETSRKMFDPASGVQLGRSPMLQTRSVEALTKISQVIDDPGLKKLVAQSTAAIGWLVPPDGRHTLLGEGSYYRVPEWAMNAAKKNQGVQLLGRSGLAAVREGDSFLLASASYYDKRRKQADDLSFVWSEQGQRILEDSGRTSQPVLDKFVRSAAAHNVVTIDGKDFPLTAKPYRNGMRAAGKVDGWYALSGKNPLLAQAASHERTWLYRPGKLLLVIDNLETPEPDAKFDRYFHFWFERKVTLDEAGQATTQIKKTPVRIFDASGDGDVAAKLVRDQKYPPQGIQFLNSKSSKPNDVLQLTSKGQKAILVTAFVVGDSKLTPKDVEVSFEHDVYYVKVGDEKLALSRNNDAMTFELGVAKGQSKIAKDNEAKAKAQAAEDAKKKQDDKAGGTTGTTGAAQGPGAAKAPTPQKRPAPPKPAAGPAAPTAP